MHGLGGLQAAAPPRGGQTLQGGGLGAQVAPGAVPRQRCPFTPPKVSPEGKEQQVAAGKAVMPLGHRGGGHRPPGHLWQHSQPSSPSRGTC